MRFAVIVGDPQPASPTLAVATAAADALTRRIGLSDRYEVIDLSTLSRRLLLPEPSAAIEDAISVTLGADLLLVVSPAVLDDVVEPWAWQVTAALGVTVAARSA